MTPLSPASSAAPLRRLLVALFAIAIAVLVPRGSAAAPASRPFDVPAGTADQTLKKFSEQAGIAVVFATDSTSRAQTNAVKGTYTTAEAIALLLHNSGLVAVPSEKTGTITVTRDPNAPRATTPAPVVARPANTPARESEAVTLSPFEVTSERDYGYVAANTLGATRTNTPIRDLPLQINVVTEDMIRDFAAYDLDQVIDRLPGVGREFNEFVPAYTIRGFSSSAAMRNGVRSLNAPDSNSVARVEVIKGPAALLYGQSNPGGVINYITKQPGTRQRTSLNAGFGNNSYRRYSLSTSGPVPLLETKKLFYLIDAVWFEQAHGERQRNLTRYSVAPVLKWIPLESTSLTFRATKQKDDFISSGGLLLLPPNHPIRTSTSTPRLPHWAVELGRDYNIHSPSSWVDQAANILEFEAKHRVNSFMDFRLNLAEHYRPRSSFREGGSNFLDTNANVVAPALPDNLPSGAPVSLVGRAPAYNPVLRTGWRTIGANLDDRVERRKNLQADLITRFKTGFLDNTLLIGVERNLESNSNRSHIYRNAAGQTIGVFTYAPFDPVSAAAKDRWVGLTQPPLASLPVNSFNRSFGSSSSIYSSLASSFLDKRGFVLVGGRYDDVQGGNTALPFNPTTGVYGALTGRSGTTRRVTPQAGVSFRVVDALTVYALFSQSVNPRIAFQPLRTAAAEQRVVDAFTLAGERVPDLNSLPWDKALDPEFGTSFEYGVKWDLFEQKLQGTFAVFDIERRNVSTAIEGTLNTAGVGFRSLSGKTRARGVDTDVAFSLSREFQIIGGFLFNETEILKADDRTEIGRRINNAPKYSGSLTGRYGFSQGALKGLAVGGGWTYMGLRRESGSSGPASRWSVGWQRVDLFASYRAKVFSLPASFTLNVKNLTDRTFRVDRDTFAAGREIRLSTGVTF